jgi:hypothetical protein
MVAPEIFAWEFAHWNVASTQTVRCLYELRLRTFFLGSNEWGSPKRDLTPSSMVAFIFITGQPWRVNPPRKLLRGSKKHSGNILRWKSQEVFYLKKSAVL